MLRHTAGHLALAAMLAGIAACQTVGPTAIRVGRAKYNDAIQQTDKQQMLLNIVRLRYNDVPYFLDVSTVLSAPAFEAVGTASATLGSSAIEAYRIGGGLTYAETPVLVYAPLGGETFSRRLLTPLDFDTISLLHNGGWNDERLFRLSVQSVNGVPNAESAGGPTPRTVPAHDVFRRVVQTMGRLTTEGYLEVGNAPDEATSGRQGQYSIDPAVKGRPDVSQLLEDLGLDPDVSSYNVVHGIRGDKDTIAIVTRPLLSVMYFLSQGVQVPPDHVGQGLVSVTRDENGEIFDWGEVMDGLMTIRSAQLPPDAAYVSVRHGDTWFYIDREDHDSKETFSLLYLLFTIQAGEKPKVSPLLSLPIGG